MAKKNLSKDAFSQSEDWYGNNAAVHCPVCGKLYIVSGFISKGQRECPRCHRSSAQLTNEELIIEWPDEQEIPKALTRDELVASNRLGEFVKLIELGGAVRPESVKGMLRKAEKVAFIDRDGRMIAAAAKKQAIPTYAEKVSQSSGYPLRGDTPELGYVAVSQECRGQRLTSKVVCRILFEFGDSIVFATTSDEKMKSALVHNGFEWVGHEWDSERAGEKLSLWIRH